MAYVALAVVVIVGLCMMFCTRYKHGEWSGEAKP